MREVANTSPGRHERGLGGGLCLDMYVEQNTRLCIWYRNPSDVKFASRSEILCRVRVSLILHAISRASYAGSPFALASPEVVGMPQDFVVVDETSERVVDQHWSPIQSRLELS